MARHVARSVVLIVADDATVPVEGIENHHADKQIADPGPKVADVLLLFEHQGPGEQGELATPFPCQPIAGDRGDRAGGYFVDGLFRDPNFFRNSLVQPPAEMGFVLTAKVKVGQPELGLNAAPKNFGGVPGQQAGKRGACLEENCGSRVLKEVRKQLIVAPRVRDGIAENQAHAAGRPPWMTVSQVGDITHAGFHEMAETGLKRGISHASAPVPFEIPPEFGSSSQACFLGNHNVETLS
jgi:hypothetical protein